MRRFGIVIFIFLCFINNDNKLRSENIEKIECRICAKNFYTILFREQPFSVIEMQSVYLDSSYEVEIRKLNINNEHVLNNKKSVLLDSIKSHLQKLTLGYNFDAICNYISKANIIDNGNVFSQLLEIKFPNNQSIIIEMSSGLPKQVSEIWLPTGESFNFYLMGYKPVELLKMPGMINDPDGFTNIRFKPLANANVVGKLVKNQVFFYVPNSYNDWWLVYKNSDSDEKPLGYVHKSRIIPFGDFPKEIKKKVREIMSGC